MKPGLCIARAASSPGGARIAARLRGAVLAVALATPAACAAPAPVCPKVSVPARAETPRAPSIEPPRPSLCWAKGRPRPRVPAKVQAEGYCVGLDAREVARVEARLRKDFVLDAKPSKLVIDFGCDGSVYPAEEVFFETGEGHGGGLALARFRKDGQRWSFRWITSSRRFNPALKAWSGEIASAQFDPVVARSRVALLARPHAVVLADPAGALAMSSRFSSHDIHLALSLVGSDGYVLERQFSGYEHTSGNDARVLPMQIATEPVSALLTKAKPVEQPLGDEDRTLFTERFLAMMAGPRTWWVKEHFVELAPQLGTLDVVPGLATLAAESGNDASVERTRDSALEAIAALTGWDPRADGKGGSRPATDAGLAALEECRLDAP